MGDCPGPLVLRRTPATAQAPGQTGSGCSRALFGQPLAALCGEDGSLPQPHPGALVTAVGRQLLSQATVLLPLLQEMLAVLHKEGPSTEGVFRRAASGTEFRELREALDHGADVDLGSQPALLLAVIFRTFLRSIPAKLLVTDLYEEWMAAMQKSGKEEKVEELKASTDRWLRAPGKLRNPPALGGREVPGANLLLLKRLLALLQHIGHNASSSRMTAGNLAICLGPNLLSPPNEDLLPLEAMLAVTEKVNVLVAFLIEYCGDIFVEEMAGHSCPSAGESPAPMDSAADLHLEEQSGPAGRADRDHQAEALLHAPPASLLDVLKEAGGDAVAESETAEAPVALAPTTLGTTVDSLGCTEGLKSVSEERR
ncbi:LOW QUALITY PROTEIN: T-cell activation Rho GTPase-activating protein-like [Aquila chrysaetos chrysaetos]|uniref:LOW QUALITY PROTEIN: T-cell activation Rho GTPase-activating protein-like n=1 Tax=Aquila chrysaetos chrysaetos TaxID=223781 RepID=UPI001B7D3AA3|nr:LOW QUALITY PROTEIN: T-cell activation Rho GTPase-activating protein-like [Aquila chrysaetos chrysaetos]